MSVILEGDFKRELSKFYSCFAYFKPRQQGECNTGKKCTDELKKECGKQITESKAPLNVSSERLGVSTEVSYNLKTLHIAVWEAQGASEMIH